LEYRRFEFDLITYLVYPVRYYQIVVYILFSAIIYSQLSNLQN